MTLVQKYDKTKPIAANTLPTAVILRQSYRIANALTSGPIRYMGKTKTIIMIR